MRFQLGSQADFVRVAIVDLRLRCGDHLLVAQLAVTGGEEGDRWAGRGRGSCFTAVGGTVFCGVDGGADAGQKFLRFNGGRRVLDAGQ